MQVSGYPGDGTVEAPRLMRWSAWQTWRSEAGLRPTVRQDGPGNSTTTVQMLSFWNPAITDLYGDEWTLLLAQGGES